MFPQQNQFGGGNQQQSPLHNIIIEMIKEYSSQVLRSGTLNQHQVQEFANTFAQHTPQIANHIAQQYPGQDSVPQQVIQQTITQYGNQLLQQMRMNMGGGHQHSMMGQSGGGNFPGVNMGSQNYQGGFNNMNPPSNLNMGDGLPSMSHRNQPQQQQPSQPSVSTKPQAQEREEASTRVDTFGQGMMLFSNPAKQYKFVVDKESGRFNTKCKSGDVVNVMKRYSLQDEQTGDNWYYNRVSCLISEPSVGRVINNFIHTNKKLQTGKWITMLNYNVFDLRGTKRAPHCEPIDISVLDDIRELEVPKETVIQDVNASIKARDFLVASVLDELITKKFNDLAKRFIRLSTAEDYHHFPQIGSLDDVEEAIQMKSSSFGKLNYHPAYEETVLRCYRTAVRQVIHQVYSPKGFIEIEDIAPDLLSHPQFVIRDGGFCEREMDIDNKSFMEAIRSRYIAFSVSGSVAVANFIPGEPGEMAEDLRSNLVRIDKITSPIDALIAREWTNEVPEFLLMTQGDESLVVKVGHTLDGVKFIYKEPEVDLYEEERR